jgi:excisionase family DNA binding protein
MREPVDIYDIYRLDWSWEPAVFSLEGDMQMVLTDLRQELEAARAEAARAKNAGVVEKLDRILAGLDDEMLLTTREAAALLGIGSVNTIKAMVHAGKIQSRKVGTHYRIPLAEVERLRHDSIVRGLQVASRIHAEIDALGTTEGLSAEELEDLEAARPGTLPWQSVVAAEADAERPLEGDARP